MEKTVYSLDDKMDYFLHKISVAPTLTLDARDLYEVDVLNEETYLIDQVMLEKGLIKIEKETRVITGKGLEISNFGGWSLYQKLLRKEKQKKFFETDSVYKKYEQDTARLKKEILGLQQQLQASVEKEQAAQGLIANLIRQNEQSKITTLIIGVALGFALSIGIWATFFR
jgi:hypothetical protein